MSKSSLEAIAGVYQQSLVRSNCCMMKVCSYLPRLGKSHAHPNGLAQALPGEDAFYLCACCAFGPELHFSPVNPWDSMFAGQSAIRVGESCSLKSIIYNSAIKKNKEKTLELSGITRHKVLRRYRVTIYFYSVGNCIYERISLLT